MIFISYSRSDIVHTRVVVEALAAEGVESWLDESNIPVGQAFVERLGTALRNADCFLLVDTPASRSSSWVFRELLTSARYKREGKYHSALRLYSADCERTEAANWDISVPIDQLVPRQIAEFLLARRAVHDKLNRDNESEGVLLTNATGLGQPSYWTGRQEELRALDDWWFGSSPGVWLSGLGGSGKSGLLQTWVTALSHLGYGESVSAEVAYFRGSEIDATRVDHAFRTGESKDPSSRKLLLVDGHDEARSTHDVEDVVREALHWGTRVLVTSRSAVPQWLSRYFISLDLATMTRRDSVAVLNQFGITGPESNQLASELGDHPLAILVLSRSLAAGKTTASEALADLRSARSERSAGSAYTAQSLRATLSRSVQGLTSDARSLLETLSQNPEDATAPPRVKRPAIRELVSAGLVQVDHFERPRQLSVHPLVRKFVCEERGFG
jgi:hypothetical protein